MKLAGIDLLKAQRSDELESAHAGPCPGRPGLSQSRTGIGYQ